MIFGRAFSLSFQSGVKHRAGHCIGQLLQRNTPTTLSPLRIQLQHNTLSVLNASTYSNHYVLQLDAHKRARKNMENMNSSDASPASSQDVPRSTQKSVLDPGMLIHEAPMPADGILPNAGKPKFYLICYNVAKRANIGNIMRSACAFGAAEILVIGTSGHKMQYFGAQGTQKHVTIRMFLNFKSIVAFVKSQDCSIVGIEIRDDAKDVATHPFTGNTAFILGNEGHGLDPEHAKHCDSFVYIPHYGAGTASLNVTVAGSIIFSHFGRWAGYTERARDGEKYVVPTYPIQRGPTTEFEIQKHEERKARKMMKLSEGGGGAATSAAPPAATPAAAPAAAEGSDATQ